LFFVPKHYLVSYWYILELAIMIEVLFVFLLVNTPTVLPELLRSLVDKMLGERQ
jgi:hypothetical protein